LLHSTGIDHYAEHAEQIRRWRAGEDAA
jgi:hypothetical protein